MLVYATVLKESFEVEMLENQYVSRLANPDDSVPESFLGYGFVSSDRDLDLQRNGFGSGS
jgi:hypothetical protein